MAKKDPTPTPPPAPEPGAIQPTMDPAEIAPPTPAVEGKDQPEMPTEDAPPEQPGAPCRFRVNWRFDGFRLEPLFEGAEVEATEEEAAPYSGPGGVLTRLH